jgi:WD40-like Beta Propeller Repeat
MDTLFYRNGSAPGSVFLRLLVVLSAEGDFWLGSLSAGTAARVTTHEGAELVGWTPDGKQVLFRSRRAAGEGGNGRIGDQDRLSHSPILPFSRPAGYSTVTLLARLRGWSISQPALRAMW